MIDVQYYRSLAFRRLPVFLVVVMVFAAISFYIAIKLPAKYASTTRLLVESPQISSTLVASTVNVDPNQQLQIFQQRLMTRANLLDIARKFDVYPNLGSMPADEIVKDMTKDTSITLDSGRDQATFMVMKFTARSPQIAAGVLNEYVTLILNEGSQFRKSRATDTLDFFQNEVDRLNKELNDQSSKILVFQSDNKDALPSTLNYRLREQSDIADKIAANNQQRANLEDQKRNIVQLYDISGLANAQTQKQRTPDEIELDNLRNQLNQALLVYTAENPKVKILQNRVDALSEKVKKAAATEGTPASRSAALLKIQMDRLDQQIADLKAQNETLQKRLDVVNANIDKTPANQIALDALNRQYTILEDQYNAAVQRLNTASAGQRVEVLSKGERVAVVDQPSVPDQPTSPNRPMIAAAGTGFGALLAGALIVLLEVLNSTVRRPADLTARFGIAPLAVLPVVRSPADRLMHGFRTVGLVAVLVLGVPLVLFLVNNYYLPLDVIAGKAMTKLGI